MDGSPSRRRVLAMGLGGAGALALAGCVAPPGPAVVEGPWDCGVASGLHGPGQSVLWTRFAPGALSGAELRWEVAEDPGFTRVVASGAVAAGPGTDGCAKVLATGLTPGAHHWYRFSVDGMTSPVGRTWTPPSASSTPAALRLAVGSCQDFSSGFFPAWRAVAESDVHAVVHLGDYIYESRGSYDPLWDVRDDPSRAALDLGTYRAKYRLYRSDADLRAAHAAHPFAPVWDDHEFVNNCHRGTIAEQPARAAAAYRAWFDYQPVWPIDGSRIHRRLRFGRLADLSLLDTRQYRDPNPDPELLVATDRPPGSIAHDPDRTLMGSAQRDWLLDGLGAAQAEGVTWKILGQQIMVAPLRWIDLSQPPLGDEPGPEGVYFNLDQWDGYGAERDTLTAFLHGEGISNTAVLTGDIHSFWQASVHRDVHDATSPAVAQEFVCGSISSTAASRVPGIGGTFSEFTKGFSPAFRHVDWERRGFGLLSATPDAMSVEYHVVDPGVRDSIAQRAVRFDWAAGTDEVLVSS